MTTTAINPLTVDYVDVYSLVVQLRALLEQAEPHLSPDNYSVHQAREAIERYQSVISRFE